MSWDLNTQPNTPYCDFVCLKFCIHGTRVKFGGHCATSRNLFPWRIKREKYPLQRGVIYLPSRQINYCYQQQTKKIELVAKPGWIQAKKAWCLRDAPQGSQKRVKERRRADPNASKKRHEVGETKDLLQESWCSQTGQATRKVLSIMLFLSKRSGQINTIEIHRSDQWVLDWISAVAGEADIALTRVSFICHSTGPI